MKGEYDQLAAVLKSCGIVASHYDANNMAQSINNGVKKSGEYFSRAYNQFQQDGKVDYTKLNSSASESQPVMGAPNPSLASVFGGAETEVLEQPVAVSEPDPIADIVVESTPVEEAPAEEKKTLSIFEEEEDALQLAEDILREKEVDSTVDTVEKKEVLEQPVSELEVKAPVEELKVVAEVAQEIKAEQSAAPQVAAAVATQPVVSTEELARKMAEEMFRKMAAEQSAQQLKLQQQLAEQQQMMMKLMQQQAAAQAAAAAQPKPAPQPVVAEQPRQQKPQQTFTYPAKSTASQSSAFREVPVDKNRPKPTLTKEEMKSTDITHWFNFSKR